MCEGHSSYAWPPTKTGPQTRGAPAPPSHDPISPSSPPRHPAAPALSIDCWLLLRCKNLSSSDLNCWTFVCSTLELAPYRLDPLRAQWNVVIPLRAAVEHRKLQSVQSRVQIHEQPVKLGQQTSLDVCVSAKNIHKTATIFKQEGSKKILIYTWLHPCTKYSTSIPNSMTIDKGM